MVSGDVAMVSVKLSEAQIKIMVKSDSELLPALERMVCGSEKLTNAVPTAVPTAVKLQAKKVEHQGQDGLHALLSDRDSATCRCCRCPIWRRLQVSQAAYEVVETLPELPADSPSSEDKVSLSTHDVSTT